MPTHYFTTSFLVDRYPEEVFTAVNNVRGWWSESIEGVTDTLGGEFTYTFEPHHRSTQKITELVPNKKVVWRVQSGRIEFVTNKKEWNDTEIVFEISRKRDRTELRFAHVGLTPTLECYDACSNAWATYIGDSLRNLIVTGRGKPDTKKEQA